MIEARIGGPFGRLTDKDFPVSYESGYPAPKARNEIKAPLDGVQVVFAEIQDSTPTNAVPEDYLRDLV